MLSFQKALHWSNWRADELMASLLQLKQFFLFYPHLYLQLLLVCTTRPQAHIIHIIHVSALILATAASASLQLLLPQARYADLSSASFIWIIVMNLKLHLDHLVALPRNRNISSCWHPVCLAYCKSHSIPRSRLSFPRQRRQQAPPKFLSEY